MSNNFDVLYGKKITNVVIYSDRITFTFSDGDEYELCPSQGTNYGNNEFTVPKKYTSKTHPSRLNGRIVRSIGYYRNESRSDYNTYYVVYVITTDGYRHEFEMVSPQNFYSSYIELFKTQ